MLSSRAISSSLHCHNCRSAILRSFIATPQPNGVLPPRLSLTSSHLPLPTRTFATNRRLHVEQDASRTSRSTEQATISESSNEPPPSNEPTKTSAAALPWYLQNQYSRETSHDEIDERHRQNIPELPVNPPPLLQTILEYVSITAGLDDLNLLDLRHLDPPPALGPKLIMIVGTARSEKHLHVSADRFCRWLRREHGLKANAAGLLGRNELKIKLRRKMKRMKMLANVGGKELEGNIDDGIRTGWICCTIGKIEAHPEDTDMPGDDVENFVGFREVKPGVNVVVQMFTEEKRDEIDLETLWSGVLKTHDRKTVEAEEKLKGQEEESSSAATSTAQSLSPKHTSDPASKSPAQQFKRTTPTKSDVFPGVSNQGTTRQLRRLHTVGLRDTPMI